MSENAWELLPLQKICQISILNYYSRLSNNHGVWNKRKGRAKVAKSINVEVGFFGKN